jgi:hypothetical protein
MADQSSQVLLAMTTAANDLIARSAEYFEYVPNAPRYLLG